MSNGLDPEMIRENYQRMTDDELVRTATVDAFGLTEEAQEIIRQEVVRRNLNTDIIKQVKVQNKEYTLEEIDLVCEQIRGLDCPVCGSSGSKLNGVLTNEVMSFMVLTRYSRKLKIACPSCLKKANNTALATSLILGWWGIPWGPIRTVQAIFTYAKGSKAVNLEGPNDYLRGFVLPRVWQISTCNGDRERLRELLQSR